MNAAIVASAVSLVTAACAAFGFRMDSPFAAKAADPALVPSSLRNSLRSTIPTPPWAGRCPSG
jgi:hypothetical protein